MSGSTSGSQAPAVSATGASGRPDGREALDGGIHGLPGSLRRLWQAEEANTRYLYLEVAWFGVLAGIAGAFLSVYVLRLGGSNTLVGLLTAAPALLNIIWLLPAAGLIERQSRRLPLILTSAFLQRLAFLLAALVPSVVYTGSPELIAGLVILGSLPASVASIAFSSMLADVVPLERRARVVSLRSMLVAITATLATLLGGKFLDLLQPPASFQWLFGAGFLASLVSLYYLSRLKVAPVAIPERSREPGGPPLARRLADQARLLWGNRAFRRFSLSSFAFHWGFFAPIPLYSIYWVRSIHATDGWIGAIAMINTAASIVAYPLWGRLASRRGLQPVLLAATAGSALYPLLTALCSTVEPLLVVSVFGGISGAAFNLGFYNALLEVTPSQRRPSFMAAYTSLVNVAVFAAPLLGTALADGIGIGNALLVGGGLRLLGSVFFLRWPSVGTPTNRT